MKKFILVLTVACAFEGFSQPFQIPPNANHSGGSYQIYRNSFQDNITINNIRKPLIIIEGYDPLNTNEILAMYNAVNGAGIASQLHNIGYDIVVLNFNDGGDYIQRNARVLKQLIQNINLGKSNNEELIVMGFSMGGLIARYALVDMENANIDHETRLYVSFDSPHKGAHVPASIQALALTFNSPTYQVLFPEMNEFIYTYNSPAAKQMLKYRLSGATQASGVLPISTEHSAFMSDINNLNANGGFPEECTNIGISLGSWDGVGLKANFDSDGDGENDPQHSGFPALYINFPQSQDSDPNQNIWNLNTCNLTAASSIQSYLSTAFASDYPYWNERSSYLNLGNDYYATYWYRNSTESPLFPLSAWSRHYSYQNNEAIDFAPGGYADSYSAIVTGLNSVIDCSYAYYDNSSFVSTVSALSYNTTDLFHNISADQNKFNQTPFDDIFGFCGKNNEHGYGEVGPELVAWLYGKIQNIPVNACACLPVNNVIFGSPNVCNSSTTFTLQNTSTVTNTTWSTSENLQEVSGQNTNFYTVTGNTSSSGDWGWIKATTYGNCESTSLPQKNIWVGAPEQAWNSNLYVQGSSNSNPVTLSAQSLYTFQMDALDGATSYDWVLPSGFSFLNSYCPGHKCNTAKIWTSSQNGSYQIRVYPRNTCGSSGTGSQTLTVNVIGGSNGGGGGPGGDCIDPPCSVPIAALTFPASSELKFYPNPADQVIHLDFYETKYDKQTAGDLEVILLNAVQEVVYSKKTKANKITVPTNNIPEGIYFLQVIYPDEVVQEQIIISH